MMAELLPVDAAAAPGRLVLTVEGVTKSFPGVRALAGASLDLRAGSVHALLGENGAGKSTLIKVLTGVHKPDAGTVTLDGEPVHFASPHDAAVAGIAVVHQERNLVPDFSVGENIALQVLPRRRGFVDRAEIERIARRCLAELGLDLDPATKVRRLGPAHSQLVEIAKALALDARVLLLDEPTASLTEEESDRLFTVVRRLAERDRAIVFVSHKLEEVFAHCDTATVLRDGRTVLASEQLAGLTRTRVVEAMVGREHLVAVLPERTIDPATPPRLSLQHISTAFGHSDVSLDVRPGEIVALYGLVGAGRSELARAVIGLEPVTGGTVAIDGAAVTIRSLGEALNVHRLGYVTENRKEEGVFLDQPVVTNIAVTVWRRLRRFWSVSASAERAVAERYVRDLGIRISGLDQIAGTLSGGNQQKVSLAKWLAADCRILIIDEPTVGIDVRTKGAFHELIAGLATDGAAVLLISSDLTEVVTLADRILVMHERAIAGEVAPGDRDYGRLSREVINFIHGPDTAAEAS